MIESYLPHHERVLRQILDKAQIPAEQLRMAINYVLFPGGKRIRPLLVYLAGELLQINLQILDVIAAAIEISHCYSLVHDDLPAMDNDDFRRGKPSCHKKFDEACAILVGDGMQALALEILLTDLAPWLPPIQIISLTQKLLAATGLSGMISGQSLDLSLLAQHRVTQELLQEIHDLKTGKLIVACMEMVLAAQEPEAYSERAERALLTYAQHLGLVFQMQDDYLDCYADSEFLGKGRHSDVANQKTTFAQLFTQSELKQEITAHFQIALDSLNFFGKNANRLIQLTKHLEGRTLAF